VPHKLSGETLLTIAGLVCAVAAVQFIAGVQLAQAYYPNYSVTQQYLSDLGATCPGGLGTTPCFILEPSGIIWGATLSLMGLLSMLGAGLIFFVRRIRLLPALLGMWGLGTAIAGWFPQSVYIVHGPASALAFVAGSIAALITVRLHLDVPRLLGIVCTALGAFSLIGIALLRIFPFEELNTTPIGGGGVERLIVYPIVGWELLLGAFLVYQGRRPAG
jgi:hypothetical membrane protein